METLQFLLRQIDDPNNVLAVRTAIIQLIRQLLNDRQDSLDEWEKAHLTNAINALGVSVEGGDQSQNTWLRLCLADLAKALTPSEQRGDFILDRPVAVESMTHETLMQALESVTRKIE